MRSIALFLVFFSVIGCTPFGGFKPPPMWWERFLDVGVNEERMRVAMLECGSNVPGEAIEFSPPDGNGMLVPQQSLNQMILISKCMKASGFPYRDTGTCDRWKDLPACKPDAVIPTRSVENRLNSPYCKTYPETRLCQPVVVSEAEWNEMHKDEIAARRRMLDEVKRQGYSTSVGTGEAKYCREEARKNAPQPEARFYFEKCLKEKFKVWNPFLSFE
jgi:hypothetical protein